MNIASFLFFIFVFVSLFLYYILPKKLSFLSLIIISLYFLFYNSLSLINILLVTLIFIIAYLAGILIKKYNKNKKSIFIISIIFILGILVYFKYLNFFINILNLIPSINIGFVNISSPTGISYFSLIMIGYIIDIYWDVMDADKNPLRVLLFMIYYPILTSGPFIKYNDVKEELFTKNKFKIDNILNGLLRMMLGLFKVLIISLRIKTFVDFVYADITNMNGIYIFLSIIAYTLELYTNFSGSIDIVIGVSKMFDINLKENFDNPFISETITEFWRRWHITLGIFLKNYIFYPLLKSDFIQKLTNTCKNKLGKKGKKIPTFICMFILWCVIGFWHGGAFKYILASGILQFIFIFLEDILGLVNKKTNKLGKIFRIIRTFMLFSFSMIFFRAMSINEGILLIKNLFNTSSLKIISEISLKISDVVIMIISLIILFIYDNKKIKINEYLNKKSNYFKLSIILLFILIILLFGVYGFGFDASEFIYGAF